MPESANCSVDECNGQHYAKGMCYRHYQCHWINRDPAPCVIDGCDALRYNIEHGWCMRHYLRWRRHGDPRTLLNHRKGAGISRAGVCTVEGCTTKRYLRGLCRRHYRRSVAAAAHRD